MTEAAGCSRVINTMKCETHSEQLFQEEKGNGELETQLNLEAVAMTTAIDIFSGCSSDESLYFIVTILFTINDFHIRMVCNPYSVAYCCDIFLTPGRKLSIREVVV